MPQRNSRLALALLIGATLAAGCSEKDPAHHIASAKEYLAKNDTKAATIEVKNALQLDPGLGEPRFILGTILLRDGDAVGAEIEFRKALAAKYPPELVVPELARSMLRLGQTKKLVDEFGNTRFDQQAANADLQTSLAAAFAALGRPGEAEAALTNALRSDAKYAPALIARARQKAAAQDFDGALKATEEIISRDPRNSDAWKLKGDILLYGRNKADEALEAYRRSTESDPNFAPGRMAVLAVLLTQGKLDDAAKELELLKKAAPNSLQTLYAEGQLAYKKGNYKLARDLSQRLLRAAPNSPRVLELAGAVELQMNSPAQAEIYLTRATQAAPELVLARRLLVTSYLRSGQPAKALAALKAGPGGENVGNEMLALAGEAYLQNGDAKKAEEYFARALKLDPDNARMRTALAMTRLASGETASALDELQNIAASDRGPTADLALISTYLRQREFEKALGAIDKLEAKKPNSPTTSNLRGQVQLALKDRAAARKSFERALSLDPSFFAAAANLATMDVADNKPDDAKKRFEALLAKNPKSGPALLALAKLAATKGGTTDEVAALLTKAVEANPDELAPHLLLIDLYLRSNDMNRATAAAQSAAAALPNSPDALSALGRVQQLSGDVNRAIATYGKVILLQPLSPGPYVRLAEAQTANKDKGAAEQSLRKALEIQPEALDAQRGLIVLYLDAGKYKDAAKIARTIQEQRPQEAVGYILEGDIAMGQKDTDGAAAALRSGLRRAPSTEVVTKLHSVLVLAGKTQEADRVATAWKQEHPNDAIFLFHLGDWALARNDPATAERNYLGVLKIQPDNAIALNNLAWATARLGKDGAVGYAERAAKLAPDQPDIMDTLAMMLSDGGNHARAIEIQKKALALQPSNAQIRLNLAKIYIKAGNKSQAKIELDALAKLGEKLPIQGEVSSLLKAL